MVFTPTEIIGLAVIAVAVLVIGLVVTQLDQRVGKHADEVLDDTSEPNTPR